MYIYRIIHVAEHDRAKQTSDFITGDIYMILHEAELCMGQNYNHGDQIWFYDKNAIFFLQ